MLCFQIHPKYAEYREIKLDVLGDGSRQDQWRAIVRTMMRVLLEDPYVSSLYMYASEVSACSLLRPSLRYGTASHRIPISDRSRGTV